MAVTWWLITSDDWFIQMCHRHLRVEYSKKSRECAQFWVYKFAFCTKFVDKMYVKFTRILKQKKCTQHSFLLVYSLPALSGSNMLPFVGILSDESGVGGRLIPDPGVSPRGGSLPLRFCSEKLTCSKKRKEIRIWS